MINESKLLDRKILKNGDKFDQSLLWMLVLLVSFGLLMVYSASIAWAGYDGDQWQVVRKQAVFVGGGTFAALLACTVKMSFWRRYSLHLLLANTLVLLLILFVGRNINGAKRWISLGFFSYQPSESYKLVLIFYLAAFFNRRAEVLKELKSLIFPAVVIGGGLGLILLEPDLGATVVAALIALGMLFLADLPKKWFFTAVSFGFLGLVMAILLAPYRMERVTSFLDPFRDPLGKGYQLIHSLIANARGQWFGTGPGASLDKRFFLTESEAHTDFIFAVISEEWGFFGMCLLVFCYCWLVWRAFSIGKQARDLGLFFSSFVSYGIALWIGVQSFFHIGVNIGLLPTKGLTLPLVSYGGSAVVVMLVSMGLLLRADYENRLKMRGYKVEG
ncbi:cell division protein FtsW [Neisseria sp. oral taxon 020 str. F0370]|uniref:putative lipid II flippase FtsW n=1 Tax=Neisseria sp. oral taxon 020 TaxID=712401 RepID=UPI0002A3912B|nr:putative lipid II flippase FtsW [Neisseria sp. oral taxon 020]EKY02509.1 cell division protein FtsW [Neisseria sp. oral taxon 020 str. F0370]